MYHSEKKIDLSQNSEPSLYHINEPSKIESQFQLPVIRDQRKISSRNSASTISNRMLSMNSTKSCLKNILQDRTTFVEKYFTDINANRDKKLLEKEIANVNT